MKQKTVLFLINGFGVEKKESYSIYDEKLMPTFNELTKKYLFSTIESNVNNYIDGYRNISLDINELYNYSILDSKIEEKEFLTNPVLLKIKQQLDSKKSNLHMFILVDTSQKLITHLKEILKVINLNKDKNIFIHLIMSSNNIEDYSSIASVFSKINIDLSSYAKISLVLGLSSIDNNVKDIDLNFFFKMFITKVGEKWQSFTQKFDVLYGTKVLPRNTKPFIINTDFSLNKDDVFMFFNYDSIDLTKFINTLSQIKFGTESNNFSYYSLFPVTSSIKIENMYDIKFANNYLVSNLEKISAKALVLCLKDQVSVINYFCNGLKNEATNLLTFVDIEPYMYDPNQMISIINQFDHDLIIINYEIDSSNTTVELKERLSKIDNVLKAVYENISGSKYSLVISSLYGLSKIMTNEKNNICQVIFRGKVPFIFIDDFITKKLYLIEPGTINDIFKSIYKNIKRDSNYDSIIEKKNPLYKMFFK